MLTACHGVNKNSVIAVMADRGVVRARNYLNPTPHFQESLPVHDGSEPPSITVQDGTIFLGTRSRSYS